MVQAVKRMDNLPKVRGRYRENAPLGASGWFRCGGTAQVQFKPADLADLQAFLKACPSDIPVHIFGALSNSIIRDGGLEGVTIRLGREFSQITIEGDTVTAGALALDANVAQVTAEAGLGGLEFLSGIPGSIGGALRMNAGCYGTETNDVLVSCQALDRQGALHEFTPEQMGMSYRHIDLSTDYLFINATFRCNKESPETVQNGWRRLKKAVKRVSLFGRKRAGRPLLIRLNKS